jgi:lipopolysaccharide biosynthesis glycosyltransferase
LRNSIWIGWDPREAAAFAVARDTMRKHCISPIPIKGVVLDELRAQGLYTRPHSMRDGRIWDDISDAPCATEFSNARFLVPTLVKKVRKYGYWQRWAMFLDCDMLVRGGNIEKLFASLDPEKAVYVVKHNHVPAETTKMDGQIQTTYSRKNWSSFMIFQVDHLANELLTPDLVNSVPGRDLHGFCWLRDEEIGELDPAWNYLVGHTQIEHEPNVVHFTDGLPFMAGYESVEFSDEWRQALALWAM